MLLVSFTCVRRWFPGQSLREKFLLTRNAVDRSYRHCHLSAPLGTGKCFLSDNYVAPLAGTLLAVEVPREIVKTFYTPSACKITLFSQVYSTQQCLQVATPSSPSVTLAISSSFSSSPYTLCKIFSPITYPS